jgi:hypothetical protein
MNGVPYSASEDATIARMRAEGESFAAISAALHRPFESVRFRARIVENRGGSDCLNDIPTRTARFVADGLRVLGARL